MNIRSIRNRSIRKSMMTFLVSGIFVSALPASAQQATPSAAATTHAGSVASACLSNWESPACLQAMSNSNMVLISNYGAELQQKGKNEAAESIKQHCAASTAAREQQFPAYAMKSAFTECANTMSDVTEQTGISPDPSHYQLLVASVLCMNGDRQCAPISQALKKYAH